MADEESEQRKRDAADRPDFPFWADCTAGASLPEIGQHRPKQVAALHRGRVL